jgi:D-alanine-D-alanine ligase
MTEKLNIAVLCGGQSAEHEVSIQSAKNVIQALNPQRYNVLPFFISKQGAWYLLDSSEIILRNAAMSTLPAEILGERLMLNLGNPHPFMLASEPFREVKVDVIFPVWHGTHGEDGTLQGMLELMNVPYVGAGTLGSAVCMDKEITKILLHSAGITVAKWLVVHKEQRSQLSFAEVVVALGLPFFVKPANTGSSVGVAKVKSSEDFVGAMATAGQYDHKIILEEFISGREIECAVLGNEKIEASLPGEIIPHHEFYTYAAKYLDPEGASLKTPAEIPEHLIEKIKQLAIKSFRALCCEGMARVDFFLTPDERLYVNEANTLPGFTLISMYPKLWAISGLNYNILVDRLVTLALQRFEKNRVLLNKSFNEALPALA